MITTPTVNSEGLLTIRVGVVKHAAPTRNLYRISPTDCALEVPYIGVPMGTRDLIISSTTAMPTYAVGDTILYIKTDSVDVTLTPIVLILCALPSSVSSAVSDIRTTLVGDAEIMGLDSYIDSTHNSLAQDTWLALGDSWQNYNPDNIVQGDYVIANAGTSLIVSEHTISTTAGSVKHLASALTGTDISSALFQRRYNIAEDYHQQLLSGYLMSTRKLAGHVSESYTKNQASVFPLLEQYSNLLCGYRRSVLNAETDTGLSVVSQDTRGGFEVRASRGISFVKTADIPVYDVATDDSVIVSDDIKNITPTPDLTELDALVASGVLTDKSGIIDGTDWGIDYIPMVPDTASMSDDPIIADETRDTTQSTSCFHLLPDGSVVIRDAWGSEIRLSHGNIQIAAANNLVQIAGRDLLNILSGMYAVNAGKGVELASATDDVVLSASRDLKVHAENELQLTGSNIAIDSGSYFTLDCKQFGIKAGSGVVSGGVLALTAKNTQITGDNQCLISSGRSILAVHNNGITVGSSMLDVHGNMRLSKKGCTFEKVINSELKDVTVRTPYTGATLAVEGYTIVDGSIHTNSWLQVVGTVAANMVAAKQTTARGGIYGLRNKPKKVKITSDKSVEGTGSGVAIYDSLRQYFLGAYKKVIHSIFSRRSKACAIWEPKFSSKGSSTVSCTVATVDYEGRKQYIYPGERFWNSNGLYSWQEDRLSLDGPSIQSGTATGVTGLRLNKDNVE